MSTSTYLTLREDTLRALREFRLADALRSLKAQIGQINTPTHFDLLRWRLQMNYDSFLDSLQEDPVHLEVQEKQLAQLQETYRVCDDLHRYFRFEFACGFVRPEKEVDGRTMCYNILSQENASPSVSEVFKGEGSNDTLFNVLWTAPQWTQEQAHDAEKFLDDENADGERQAMAASAVTLRLFSSFDDRQFVWLCRAAQTKTSGVLHTRALIGAVLVAIKQQEWLPLFPEAKEWASQLVGFTWEYPPFWSVLQRALWIAQETVPFSRHLIKELLPQIIKSKGAFPLETEELMQIIEGRKEMTPAQKNIQRVFLEVARVQTDGMDINYGIFGRFTMRHPFFHEAAHWFYEYSPEHPELAGVPSGIDLRYAERGGRIGNTERFSWVKAAEVLQTITDENEKQEKRMQINSLFAEADVNFTIEVVSYSTAEDRIKGYLRDLFRFCSLYVYRNEQDNPFRCDLFLAENPLFASAFEDPEERGELAEFCLPYDLWNPVISLLDEESTDVETLRKLAFAHYKLKNFEKAVSILEAALQIDANNYEVLHDLARLCNELDRNEETLTYLVQMEALKPEDEQLLFRIAIGYARLELYEEALTYLYKLEYLFPNNLRAQRVKALCLFCLRRFAEAEPLLEALLDADVEPLPLFEENKEKQLENWAKVKSGDYFHAAHNAWSLGKVPKAIEYYMNGLSIQGKKRAEVALFHDNAEELTAAGWQEVEYSLICDLVNRELEK